MARHKRSKPEPLDYHEGLSSNQVKIILTELGFGKRIDEFNEWMFGQTCGKIPKWDVYPKVKEATGIYEYDLFRWISSQKTGVAPIWD